MDFRMVGGLGLAQVPLLLPKLILSKLILSFYQVFFSTNPDGQVPLLHRTPPQPPRPNAIRKALFIIHMTTVGLLKKNRHYL